MTGRQGKKRSRRVEEREQDNAEYKRFSVQRTTGEETSKFIYQSIYY